MSPRRLRTLLIALSLAGLASVIGIALFLIRADNVPLFHRVTDLAVHFGAIGRPKYFGASSLPYDDTPNDNLGIVTIDEFSVGNAKAGLGQFPFPRSVYGKALERLAAAGAKTVAFDVIFVDPGDPAQNEAFARGMHRVPTVLADVIDTTTAGRIGIQPPVPVLKNAAAAVGFTSTDRPGRLLHRPAGRNRHGRNRHERQRAPALGSRRRHPNLHRQTVRQVERSDDRRAG